jgi:transposase
MNFEQFCFLLLDTEQVIFNNIWIDDGEIQLAVESTTRSAACPICHHLSAEIHSHYLRYPKDLAWADYPVVIQLQVKRFFCRNRACPKRTFAEQFPHFVSAYARQTDRVREKQQNLGVNISARVAEFLLEQARIGISDTTLNRMIRALPDPEVSFSYRVIGVDDWAKRKGQRYGTILVDLEHGSVADVLDDRTSDTLANWLKERPDIEIVSRDRSQTYADGIERGAPQATQVADRWHLLKNISDTLSKVLQQEYASIQKQLGPQLNPLTIEAAGATPGVLVRPLTQAEERRKKRIEQTQRYFQQGWTQKAIARQLHLNRKTIRRYLRGSSSQIRRQRTHRLIDRLAPYLLRRWNEGCHNAMQLYREIQPKGFSGSSTTVRLHIQQLRRASGLPDKVRNQAAKPLAANLTWQPPTLRTLTWWILKRPEDRSDKEESLLSQILVDQPKLQESVVLARNFTEMVRQKQVEKLDTWLTETGKSRYRIWQNFAAGLRQDEAAVRTALKYPWSNGPTEGHINRLKCIKRMMYGRAYDDLLRKRVLWQGYRAFT